MNNLGWVSLHRKFLTWKFFNDSDAVKLFIYLLLSASPKDEIQGNFALKSGQIIIRRRNLAKDVNISERKIRTILAKFQASGVIDIQTCVQFSLVTILNYKNYQKKSLKNFAENIPQNVPQNIPQNDPRKTASQLGLSVISDPQNDPQNSNTIKNVPQNVPQNDPRKTASQLGLSVISDPQNDPPYICNNKFNNKKCVCVNTAAEFENELKKYESKYTEEFRRSFFLWWTQRDESGKMRFQSMGLFDLEKRLELWKISEQKIKTWGGRRGRQQQPTEATLNPETVAFMTGSNN